MRRELVNRFFDFRNRAAAGRTGRGFRALCVAIGCGGVK